MIDKLYIMQPQFIELILEDETRVMERISNIDSIMQIKTGTRIWSYDSEGKRYEEGTDYLNLYSEVSEILKLISNKSIEVINER